DIQVDDQAICLGSSVTLNATSSITGAVFTWYSEAALTNRVGTGSSFEVVAPTADVKYYVTVKNAGTCENVVAEAKVVTVKVKPRGLAADIQVDDQTICLGGNVTLKATSTITGAVFNWYTDAQLRNKVYTGSDYPVIPTITTTYYVTVQSTAVCENLAVNVKDVTVTVQPRGLASDIQVDDQVICLGSSVTLKATSTITGAVFNWYTDARLRNKVYTGSDYPVTPTITTTYYVTVKNTITCENISVNAKTVKVIVNPLPAIPTLTSRTSTIFCEGGSTILTSSALTGNRWYKDNIMIPNATAQTYTATESGSYTVIQTNTNGCISPVSLPITVTKNLYPVIPGISPSGTTTFCDGGVVTLTSSSATGNQWYKSGILIPGATHPTYDVSEIGVYTVNVTNTAGCTSAVSASTTVTVNPVPKGFDDQINTLSCSRSTFTYNLQSFNINNTIRGGNGVPSSFTWTVNPTTVSGAVDGFGNAITASLINTGMSPEEVIYTVTPRGLSVGCDGLPFKIKVLVPVCSAISITKTADRSSVAVPGDQINYTITVSNVANASHHNLIVNDPLTGGNLSNPTGDNGNHILEKGEFWTYHTSYVVTQTDLDNNGAPDTDLGEVQNIATVKSTESPTPRTAVANVAIRQNPIIRLVKTGVLNQDYRTINYTFFITNKGNITLKDLQLTDPKLPGLSIPNLTELGPGASTSVTATYTIKEIEKRAGTVINTAKVTGTYNLGSRVSDISGTNENNDDPTVVDIIRYPSAVDDFAKTKADIEVMVPVTNNDRPSLFPLDVATVDVKVQPINGKLQLNRDGKVVYHPNKGYVGLETFTYMVNDDNGLSSNVAVVTINVIPADLEIPNTFTPNGDGKNDTFLIKGRENYESIEISIFNRWGDEVYKNKNYKDEWDGAGLNEGTYFYVLRLKKAGKEEIRRSWVLIKR
ncbi:Ig-like domain-containing protein, partial [Pedobacter caeni]